jgi:bifunctional non-homologous end joining protein LigD
MRKSLRDGKVLIDWSQNNSSKTTVAVYSLRARPEPTVSTPVTWQEVDACAESDDPNMLRFEADDVLRRVDKYGDLMSPLIANQRAKSKS